MDIANGKNKRERSAHRFLHFYRNHVMNVLVLLVILLYFVLRMAQIIPQEMQRCYGILSQNIEQAQQYQEYSNDANELYISVQDEDYLSACRVFVGYIEAGKEIQLCIDRINQISDDFDSVFYLKSNGDVISYPDRAPLELSPENQKQLLSEGILQHEGDSVRYFALPCGDEYMIVRIDEACTLQLTMDVLQLCSLDGFIYDNQSLDIVEADEEAIPGNVGSMYVGKDIESRSIADSGYQLRLISPYSQGLAKYTHMKLAAIQPLGLQNAGKTICVYIPCQEILSNILVKSGLPTLLCLAFISLNIFGALHFREIVLRKKRSRETGEDAGKTIRLPFGCFIDAELTRCILFMQFFLGLLVIFCSVILLTLNRFSISYEDAKYDLEQTVNTEAACADMLNDCWEVYSSPVEGMAEAVDAYLELGDIKTDSVVQDDLRRLAESTLLQEISVYDQNGKNVFTTADSVGYPLSSDPSSTEYSFWGLMDGHRDLILVQSDEEDGAIYCGKKRTDAVGIVELIFSDQGFCELEKKLSKESFVANLSYRDSCMFIDKTAEGETGSGSVAYRISADGTRISCESPGLPVLVDKETFCGFRTYNNRQYFVVGLGDTDCCLFYFQPVSEIMEGFVETFFVYAFFVLVICLLNFLGCAVFSEESFSSAEEEENVPQTGAPSHRLITGLKRRVTLSEIKEISQRTILRHGFYNIVGLIAVMLVLDVLLNENSMLSFLFHGNWERGLNLFAFSSITLTILAVSLMLLLMKLFFEELAQNFPAQYVTGIQMACSILYIVIIVWMIVFAANEVGIDTATILASVGISGLALGIAAKDTINDMLNGIFIILDGRIQVGDWVEVGGFYGEVKRIGIRTTKVQYYNTEKSINNSDMKNLSNLSKGNPAAYLVFDVARGTDISALKQLLKEATPRFQEACKGNLTSDFILSGVKSFDAHSITCCGFAMVINERRRKSAEKSCRKVLLELLEENSLSVTSDLVVGAKDVPAGGNHAEKEN